MKKFVVTLLLLIFAICGCAEDEPEFKAVKVAQRNGNKVILQTAEGLVCFYDTESNIQRFATLYDDAVINQKLVDIDVDQLNKLQAEKMPCYSAYTKSITIVR